jgi:hypothetical protein
VGERLLEAALVGRRPAPLAMQFGIAPVPLTGLGQLRGGLEILIRRNRVNHHVHAD